MNRMIVVALALTLGACNNNTPPPTNSCPTPPSTSWEGKWQGVLVNHPARPDAKRVDVTLEIGPMPTADNTCSPWRKTFVEEGSSTPQVKDYQLCRGQGEQDLYVDEGGGVKLTTRWLGEVLVSPYKYDTLLFMTTTRLRGDVLEDELIMANDRPVVPGGVQVMLPRLIQRTEFKRVIECPN